MNVRENYNNDEFCHINQKHIVQTVEEYMCDSKEKKEKLRFMSYGIIISIIVYVPTFFGVLCK